MTELLSELNFAWPGQGKTFAELRPYNSFRDFWAASTSQLTPPPPPDYHPHSIEVPSHPFELPVIIPTWGGAI